MATVSDEIIASSARLNLRRGGTAKASTMLQNQFVAVESETALALILLGKISAGYVQDVGPHVVAKVATNKYEHATTALETAGFPLTIQLMSLFWSV